jgi:DNA mismatch repair endonuclease MutH
MDNNNTQQNPLVKITSEKDFLKFAKELEGKTLAQVVEDITRSDSSSRVSTKGHVGYVIEQYFGIEKNSKAKADIEKLGVEIKSVPLKYNKSRTLLSVKEPLSLNIINYVEEDETKSIKDSSMYKKNKKILFVLYIHDTQKPRSEYKIKHVFLWKMDDKVLAELNPDYMLIKKRIREGKAHEIHQSNHKYLTLCPKHSGTFKDPACSISKRRQPHSEICAETRAFRLKNRYMNIIISRALKKKLEKSGWNA